MSARWKAAALASGLVLVTAGPADAEPAPRQEAELLLVVDDCPAKEPFAP
ncbi:hypothetical protein Aph01nite_74380 [Acrocarpospora phusangensis]|uniref:Uncharacterized protein n=1 Tax=Acrocarpospora phusangensis TaxID=1070424 RepID=A0A919QK28_9ACTN|nr:hypothetical protein [Acrocarpospora phusangensis]GIH29128.1 hypothetical protein Aph01nite_74380 [Acrocarpospora phusangensis]